jgi:uncharacterized protein YbjT (DUF2867 family)
MMLNNQIITIFGGSGFLGRQIIRELAAQGYTIRVASRTPQSCYDVRTTGAPGQVVPQFYDPSRPDTIGAVINGSYAVINCIGILFEKGRTKFHAAHAELPRQLATSCKRHHVERFVHISALGVDSNKSNYARTKLMGEQAVRDIFQGATILRPSVIFGTEDNFFNMFARMCQFMPALPLIGGGKTKFQPVFVGDVADAAVRAIRTPDMIGKIYELGGPDVLTFREIYEKLFENIGYRRTLLSLPWSVARFQAGIMQLFPKPLLTVDQVRSLKFDNVMRPGAGGFKDIGVTPKSLDLILPTYLDCYRTGGKFAEKKRA